jgi:syntaxin 1B/2/3
VRTHQLALEEANERSKGVTRGAEMHALREEMTGDAAAVARLAEAIKKRLAELDAGNAAALARRGCGAGSASERTRSAVAGALKRKLREVMGEFQALRARLQAEYREVVERRVFTGGWLFGGGVRRSRGEGVRAPGRSFGGCFEFGTPALEALVWGV